MLPAHLLQSSRTKQPIFLVGLAETLNTKEGKKNNFNQIMAQVIPLIANINNAKRHCSSQSTWVRLRQQNICRAFRTAGSHCQGHGEVNQALLEDQTHSGQLVSFFVPFFTHSPTTSTTVTVKDFVPLCLHSPVVQGLATQPSTYRIK